MSFGPSAVIIRPGEEDALIGSADRFHGAQRRPHDFGHDAIAHRRIDDRRRRIGAHAAGIRPLVAVEGALVVLRRRQRQRGLAVAEREERSLFAVEKFFNDKLGSRLAQIAAEDHVDRAFRLGERLRDHDALAGGEPVGLDDNWRAAGAHISFGLIRGPKALVGRRRYAVGPAQILGETFGAFEPRGGAARSEGFDAGGFQIVDDARAQRPFRSDDHEIDRADRGKIRSRPP